MTNVITVHTENPQARLLRQAVLTLQKGGVIVYPSETGYAVGCAIGEKNALDRIRRLRKLPKDHNFTLLCKGLSEISQFARVDNPTYRLLRSHTPGLYTFILPATKDVPRLLLHPKRKTIGIRVSGHPIVRDLLALFDAPLLTVSLIMPNYLSFDDDIEEQMDVAPQSIDEVEDALEGRVDLIIDAGFCSHLPSSIIDLTGEEPEVLRVGAADVEPFQW